ncbi:MAG: DUF6152 family protein [Candidatus Sphingomonas phytovorans]|nr:DUF6152 family protein [Sphingomonas sp.]WEK01146.1 MAG: DUF6152 family protein [Sphingomonas sp.]
MESREKNLSRAVAIRGWRAAIGSVTMVAVAATVATTLTEPALAHHSFAGFDKNRKVAIKGTVKQWQFTNPHSWLQLNVVENGREVEYSIEGASVNTLIRRGWGRATFKAGDTITVVMYPLLNGKKGGAFLTATFANGKTISSGITPN